MAKQRFFSWLVALILLFLPERAAFGFGMLGATDLMATPDTKILSHDSAGFALNFMEGDAIFFNLDYGLLPDLEVGLSVVDSDTRHSDDTWVTIRGKYRLLRETKTSPALAVGVQHIGEEVLEVSPYLVISKNLAPELDVDGYLGVGGGDFDGIFVGLSKTFNISPAQRTGSNLSQIQVLLEFDSDNMNLASKFVIGPRTKINFGFYDMEYWALGITYAIPK